jgi:hypothetical protein
VQRLTSRTMAIVVALAALVPTAADAGNRGLVRGSSGNARVGRSPSTSRSTGMALTHRSPAGGVSVPFGTTMTKSTAGRQLSAHSTGSLKSSSQVLGKTTMSRRFVPATMDPLAATTSQTAQGFGQSQASTKLRPFAGRHFRSTRGSLRLVKPNLQQENSTTLAGNTLGTNQQTLRRANEALRRASTAPDTPNSLPLRKAPIVNLQQSNPSADPGSVLFSSPQLDQKIDKELDGPFFDGPDGTRVTLNDLHNQQDLLWESMQYFLDRFGHNQTTFFHDLWREYLQVTEQITFTELAWDIYWVQRIPVSKLPDASGGMGSSPESDFPSGGAGSQKEPQRPIIKLEEQVVTLPRSPTTPGSGGTLGGDGNQDAGDDHSQKGDDGGGDGSTDDVGTRGGNDNRGSGGDNEPRPDSSDHGNGGGTEEGDDTEDGGTTTEESRSQRDPWGYIDDGTEVEVEHTEQLAPFPEGGRRGGGDDVGARRLGKPLPPGVTQQDADLVGPAFGTTTGADDKERPNTGGTSGTVADDPAVSRADDVGGGNLRRSGGGRVDLSAGVELLKKLGLWRKFQPAGPDPPKD